MIGQSVQLPGLPKNNNVTILDIKAIMASNIEAL